MDKRRIDAFMKLQRRYRADPVAFAEEILRFYPDDNQRPVMRDMANCNRVSVRSGQGVGKTAMTAATILWFLTVFPYARVVCTAPTRQQLNDVLWSEIDKWRSNSPLLNSILHWTKTYVYMTGFEKRWYAVARTATRPENMQGYHEENMLFVVDEASGVAEPIMEAILGTLSGANNKLLMCGNPTQTSGTFYDSHMRDRGVYRTYRISARDCPRTDKEHIASLERKYGKYSNFVRVRVDGEFPTQEDDVFIPLELLERSVRADWTLRGPVKIDIAVDVARYGDDKTVIGYKVNERAYIHEKTRGRDLMSTADHIIQLAFELIKRYDYRDVICVRVDDSGVGGGVTDRLNQIKRREPSRFSWLEVAPVMFGRKIKHAYYDDSTTYMFAVVKDMLSIADGQGAPKPLDLVLPDDEDLIAQLSMRKYEMTERSKLRVESKDEVKKRLGVSPDEADCLLLLCVPIRLKKRTGSHVGSM